MPIKIPEDLPARPILEGENIFVMTEGRANRQDIRPLEIAIVNLMPTKIATETQLLRLLGNTPLQVNVTLLRAEGHESKNTAPQHLERFYKTFSQVRDSSFDGMIITGAPVEQLAFEEVDYWDELVEKARARYVVYMLGRASGSVPSLRHPEVRASAQAFRYFQPHHQ